MSASSSTTRLSTEPVIGPVLEPDEGETRRAEAARLVWPLGLYTVLSIVMFGVPVIGHFGSHIVAVNDLDPSQLIWFLGWWPHALLHGLNPFVSNAMLYPDGYNLTWSTSMPLLSLATAPITLTVGPVVSFNVLQLLSPALSAWTAFLLCRHVVGRSLPAVIGGYIFGFSPTMLADLQVSPFLAMLALVPVFVLLVLKRVEGSIAPRRFVIAMAFALAAQLLVSGELLATSTLFGGFALLAALALFPARRRQLCDTVKLLVLSYAGATVLISPYLVYFIFGDHYPPGRTNFGAALSSFVFPPASVGLRLGGSTLVGSDVAVYLGLPLVLLAVLFLWRGRHRATTLLPVLCMVVAFVLSLGGRGLVVRDHITRVWMPWRLFWHLPALRYAIPHRFGVFVVLPAAVIVSMWLRDAGTPTVRAASPRQLAQWALALLAVAFIVPDFGNRAWNTPIADPPFFQHDAYRKYLSSKDHVLTIPTWGPSQRWVADAGFPFMLSAGSGGQSFPAGYARYPIWNAMLAPPFTLPPNYARELRRFLAAKHVTAIVVQQGFGGPWARLFGTLGVRPIATGGILLYHLVKHP